MRRAVRTVHSFSLRMSDMACSRACTRWHNFFGGGPGISQSLANTNYPEDCHRKHDRYEQSSKRRVDVIVENDTIHLLKRLCGCEHLASSRGIAEHSCVADEADRRHGAEHLLHP